MNAAGFFRKPVDGPALLDAIKWALQMDMPDNKHMEDEKQ
jgi:FixJ family two-component response regulator